MRLPGALFKVRRLATLFGTIALLSGATPPPEQGPPGESVEQIEARIRRQKGENLHAVRGLVRRLSDRLDDQRARLAADEAQLRSLGERVPEPGQELLALEAQLDAMVSGAPPLPSFDAPYARSARERPPAVARLSREPPSLPVPPANVSPFHLKDPPADPAHDAEARALRGRVLRHYGAMRPVVRDLVRARILLRELGDDSAPPPPALPKGRDRAEDPRRGGTGGS